MKNQQARKGSQLRLRMGPGTLYISSAFYLVVYNVQVNREMNRSTSDIQEFIIPCRCQNVRQVHSASIRNMDRRDTA